MSSKDGSGQQDRALSGGETSNGARQLETEPETSNKHESAVADEPVTVEEAVRTKLAEMVGGPRGGLEAATPIAAFAFAYTATGRMRTSLIIAIGVAVALLAVRLIQRSSTHHVRNGLFALIIGAAFVYTFGGAENVFLPDIIVNAVFVVLLGASMLLRRPLFGFIIGEILGDRDAMSRDTGVMKLADRMTLLLIVPGAIRLCVKLPLYLAGNIGWLVATDLILGWPLLAIVVVLAGIILARGHTPLEQPAARASGT